MAKSKIDPLSAVVVANVRRLRKARNWSAERLSSEMTNVGIPWTYPVVASLEIGRRSRIGVSELAALARVFEIGNPWDLTKAPECDRCGGAPPDGYICAACGVGGNRG